MKPNHARTAGYTLLELMVATVLFTIISGAVFSVLSRSQLSYQGESTVAAAFQQANVAIDQIVRDVHSAGYPPASSFTSAVSRNSEKIALPFAWSLGYTNAPPVPCTVGGSCGAVPGPYDLILEAADTSGVVQWIRYSLQGTTLMRASIPKVAFRDPVTLTDGALVPYLDNVLNQTQGQAIFSYRFDDSTLTGPAPNIRKVDINLIVQSAQRDRQTNQFRTITVSGQAVRLNPSQ
jgi:prepilin-type N-terminal cleavage/methylation domain-containing protein